LCRSLPAAPAEATKLLENIFRSCGTFALVNELEVVYARWILMFGKSSGRQKTKPLASWPFIPDPVWRALHPIDPFYLTWKAREYGQHTRFSSSWLAKSTPPCRAYVGDRTAEALNESRKPMKGSRVFVLGLA